MDRTIIASATTDGDIIAQRGTLAVGCFASIGRNRLAEDLLTFAHRCPDVELGVHEMARASLLPALRDGELALAILPESDHPGLQSVELWRDEVMVAVHRDHVLTRDGAVAPERLAEEIFLVSRQHHGGDMHRFLSQRVLPCECSLKTMLLDLSQSLLMDEVAAGRGVALACGGEVPGPEIALCPVDAAGASFSVRAYWVAERSEAALDALVGILARP